MTLRRAAALSVGQGVVGELRAQLRGRRPRQDRRDRCAGVDRQCRRTDAHRPPGRDACRCRPIRRRSIRRGSIRRSSNARRTSCRQGQGAGKARECDRQDCRIRAQDLLQGGLSARSALRPSTTRRAWRTHSRKPRARSERRSRSRAMCVTRSARASSGRITISPPRSRRRRERTDASGVSRPFRLRMAAQTGTAGTSWLSQSTSAWSSRSPARP